LWKAALKRSQFHVSFLRKCLSILSLIGCAFSAQAQGTIQFNATSTGGNEVPPNSDPTVATGTFSLTGNSLSFYLEVPAVTFISMSGYIQGPAGPGTKRTHNFRSCVRQVQQIDHGLPWVHARL
jgi:hypothetical protein